MKRDRTRRCVRPRERCELHRSRFSGCSAREKPARNLENSSRIASDARLMHLHSRQGRIGVCPAWPDLPEAIRAGILALVKAASERDGGRT